MELPFFLYIPFDCTYQEFNSAARFSKGLNWKNFSGGQRGRT
jgi:hypothetical protein